MDEFITVKTFYFPNDASILMAHLESEGIECRLKDGLTIQVNPLYSNAIGGVKLQVRQTNFTRAVEILEESGYTRDEEAKPQPLYFILDEMTSVIPFVNKLSLG